MRPDKQKRNKGVTEIVKMAGRGHALTIDAGWLEVAEKALDFVKAIHNDHGESGAKRRRTPMNNGNSQLQGGEKLIL